MKAVKPVTTAWIIFFICIAFIFLGAHMAKAEEPVVTDCDFKPRQSDEVIVACGSLKGQGTVSVRLCGINYVIDVICK